MSRSLIATIWAIRPTNERVHGGASVNHTGQDNKRQSITLRVNHGYLTSDQSINEFY